MVWGGRAASRTRRRLGEGATVVAWDGVDPRGLEVAGARSLEEVIGEEGRRAAAAAARTWCRLWGRVPLLDGDSFRDLVAWREMSLLWLAEGFLLHETEGARCARIAESALRMLDATGAGEVDTAGLGDTETLLLARACTARGVLFHGVPPKARPRRPGDAGRRGALDGIRRFLAPKGPPSVATSGSPGVLLVSGTGVDPAPYRALLESAPEEAGPSPVVVAATDLERWETRTVARRAAQAAAHLRERFARLRGAPGLHESYSHAGVGFGDLAARDLEGLLLAHLPAAVRQLERAVELLTSVGPGVAVVAGARRDERRTLLAACRAAGVPSLALRSAPPDADDPDREDAGPRADATLVWAPGDDPGPVTARLATLPRATLGRA